MAQQTAVEWIYSHLFPKQLDGFSDKEWGKIDKAFEQAKQIEKDQIIKSFQASRIHYKYDADLRLNGFEDAEHYYNETFGNK